MEENYHLHHPLLPKTTTTTISTSPSAATTTNQLFNSHSNILDMEENHHLHHPLLPKTTTLPSTTTTTTTKTTSTSPSAATNHKQHLPSNSPGILPRLIFLLFIGAISLYANQESSKLFNITIINEAKINSIASKRFNLFYASNDEITRLILRASQYVENILYPDGIYLKKQVNHVIVTLSRRNLTSSPESNDGATKRVVVTSLKDHSFMIEISPLVMEMDDFKEAMFLAIHHSMVKVWLFNGNGNGNVPRNIVNGIAKCIISKRLSSGKKTRLSEDFLFEGKDGDEVAKYLNSCEMHIEGFVRRLNQEMRDGWRDDEMSLKTCKLSSSSFTFDQHNIVQ